MHPNIHCSTIYKNQDMEVTQIVINIGMDKEDVALIYNSILLSHKNEWNNAICSSMNRPRNMHTEWSKSYREKLIPYDIFYIWNLKRGINKIIHKNINRNRIKQM